MISVVLPAWNAQATLGEAARSVLAQTHRDLELLLVDDGSTDGTRAVATALAEADPRVRVLARPHEGIVGALAAGLAAARGAYVARMDADDVCHPERLAKQAAMLDADPGLGLVGCLVAHEGGPGTAGYAAHVGWLNGVVTPADVRRERFVESPFAHPSVMFRHDLIGRHGGYRGGAFPEDYELWLRWLDAGVAMAKVPETLLTWRDGPARLSRTDARYGEAAFDALKARWLARWLRARGHEAVVVWGAGKTSRRRARALAAEGIAVAGYIDVDPRRRVTAGVPIRHFETLGGPERPFVVAMVGKRGAGAFIRGQLAMRGWIEETDFLMAA